MIQIQCHWNDENIHSLLCFHATSRANTLNDHLSKVEAMLSNHSTSYTSPKIQNKLIKVCEKIILDKIISKETKYFSILADKTTDKEKSFCL